MLTGRKMNDNGSFEIEKEEPKPTKQISIPAEYASIKPSSYFRYDRNNEQLFVLDAEGNDLIDFKASHVIKTLVDIHPESEAFFPETNLSQEQKEVIYRLIFNHTDKNPYFVLKSMKESVFMRDVNMLILFNNSLAKFEKNELGKYLKLVKTKSNKQKMEKIIDRFINELLIRTLELLSTASERLKATTDMSDLKNNIRDYVTGTVYRISMKVKKENTELQIKAKQLDDNITNLGKSRQLLHDKLDSLTMELEKIKDTTIRKSIGGGNNKSNDESTESTESSESTESTDSDDYVDSTNADFNSSNDNSYESINKKDIKYDDDDNNDNSSQFSAIYDI